jgi:4-hydroxy-4-methyl-2-oxoglutarate aldolase
MHAIRTVSADTLEQLRKFDTCTISNAIERFEVRTRNEGFVDSSVRCLFPHFAPSVGYAVTGRIRTSSTPISGACYYERMDWWSYVQTIPAPRFLVLEDIDRNPGLGALVGEIHANICKALDCVAYLSNGTVRDLPGVEAVGLQLFAGGVSVSHSYAHVVRFGEPVEVGGLQINPGDLLHGDQHGVLSIPHSIAADIPRIAADLLAKERELIDLCASPEFSFQKLSEVIQQVSGTVSPPADGS